MRLKRFISAHDRHAIDAAVREAEGKTSGEIVPAIVLRSSRYDWIGYRAALLGWLAATIVAFWAYFRWPFTVGLWDVEIFQVIGLFVGWLLSRFSFGARLFVPKRTLAEEVSHAAHASFLRHGLMNTRDRTGVLLFVSLRERHVQIVADKGIHEKLGEEYWKSECDRIVSAIRAGRPAEGMIAAIHSIGDKLAVHFPRRPGDKNELPNHLQFR